MQTVVRFGGGETNGEIASALRVSERSVERWRRAWRECGEAGVLSEGSPGRPRLSETQIARLEESWSAARWCTAGRTSGGRWSGSRH
ncbi:helix-turn-helix domain-containing protein [Streptomyces sp. NPDC059679]|uniref:helix-turn-helix domain-containing protein n=1 Tax=Streptomyces sp. NPDC059679 TaxID=3346903 RepID=UPI0036964211